MDLWSHANSETCHFGLHGCGTKGCSSTTDQFHVIVRFQLKNTHPYRKPVTQRPTKKGLGRRPLPALKKKRTSSFCDASQCSMTVMWPHSTQTSRQGLKRGEHARGLLFVWVPRIACYYGELVPGTEEKPWTVADPCGDEDNMYTNAVRPSWAWHAMVQHRDPWLFNDHWQGWGALPHS